MSSNRKNILKAIDTALIANSLMESSSEDETDEETTSTESSQSSEGSSTEDDEMFLLTARCCVMEKRYLTLRKNLPKTAELADVIFRADDKVFKKNARMTRQAFFGVVEMIKDHPVFHNKSKMQQADPADQLMIALGRLGFHGNGASLWAVGSRFGVGDGTVELYTSRVIRALLSLESDVVSWPNLEGRRAIKDRIEEKFKFPNCN